MLLDKEEFLSNLTSHVNCETDLTSPVNNSQKCPNILPQQLQQILNNKLVVKWKKNPEES